MCFIAYKIFDYMSIYGVDLFEMFVKGDRSVLFLLANITLNLLLPKSAF